MSLYLKLPSTGQTFICGGATNGWCRTTNQTVTFTNSITFCNQFQLLQPTSTQCRLHSAHHRLLQPTHQKSNLTSVHCHNLISSSSASVQTDTPPHFFLTLPKAKTLSMNISFPSLTHPSLHHNASPLPSNWLIKPKIFWLLSKTNHASQRSRPGSMDNHPIDLLPIFLPITATSIG